ncbi:MAG TPA: Bax inhibitor-1/YccA family protein [Acholeplasmataceae bacterium]|nr:Bax inhibitor-1/YccA family protein [Acholeplasmataceae bacterium]
MKAKVGNNVVFTRAQNLERVSGQIATIQGVGSKTILLILITFISALATMFILGPLEILSAYFLIWIITFVLLIIMSFNPRAARVLAIPYAVLEGMTVGAISGVVAIAIPEADLLLPGLALAITMAIFLSASVLYTTGVIRVSGFFRRFMYTLLLGVIITSLVVMIAGLFDSQIYEIFYGATSYIALLISIIMVIISSLYVVISLDNANMIVDAGMDKTFEWYAAFGILLNIIWLYYEVLRLLIILMSRDR